MNQGKLILLFALVLSVAMTANTECVDQSEYSYMLWHSRVYFAYYSKPKTDDHLVLKIAVLEVDHE